MVVRQLNGLFVNFFFKYSIELLEIMFDGRASIL